MNARSFFQCIKADTLSGAYLLAGEEEYIKESALSALVDQIAPISRDLNLQYLEDGTADTIISACETLPFLAERRLVICKFLLQGEEGKKLGGYLSHVPETTLLIFFLRGKADEKLGIVKTLKKEDRLVDFSPLTPLDASRWVRKQAAQLGGSITEEAARFLVALVGTQVFSLKNELTKAAFYCGQGSEITKDAISACITPNPELRVFDMVDSFLAGRTADGLRAYHRILDDGESSFRLAALLEGNFRRMALARNCIDRGMRREEVLRQLGNTYPMKKAYEGASRYTREQLLDNLRRFADVGYLQVTGQAKDADALERALILCPPQPRKK